MRPTFFAFDTETTGLDPAESEILSIGILLLDDTLEELDRLVLHAQPEKTVCTPEAANVNGYNKEAWDKRGAVSQAELFEKLHAYLKPYRRMIPIGHNVKFDLAHLSRLFAVNNSKLLNDTLSYHSLDTVGVALSVDLVREGRANGSLRLTDLCQRYGVVHENAHDAISDITATVELLRVLCKTLRNSDQPLPPPVARERKPMLEKVGETYVFRAGKHAGTTVDAADKSYLLWVLTNVTDLTEDQRAYVQSQFAVR